MLGCKSASQKGRRLYALKELIDTCWDVNCHQAAPGHHQAAELIDTCWDVNQELSGKAVITAMN